MPTPSPPALQITLEDGDGKEGTKSHVEQLRLWAPSETGLRLPALRFSVHHPSRQVPHIQGSRRESL